MRVEPLPPDTDLLLSIDFLFAFAFLAVGVDLGSLL